MNVTPKTVPATKRLGLSRSLGRNPITSTVTPKANLVNPTETPDSTIVPSKPNAAETISERNPYSGNTENLSIKSNVNETPVSSKPSTYKLSLCKSTTEAMTRKRMHSQQQKLLMQPKRLKLELKFDEIQTDESDSTQDESDTKSTSDKCGRTSGPNTPTPLSNSSLQGDIDELTKKIASIEKHQQHKSELEALKMKWQEAGRQVIEEIKEKLGQQDEEVFLAHFQIDPGLFNLNSSE